MPSFVETKEMLEVSQAVCVALQRDIAEKEKLLAEALEAMLNLAPRIRKERSGCFGDGGEDCPSPLARFAESCAYQRRVMQE